MILGSKEISQMFWPISSYFKRARLVNEGFIMWPKLHLPLRYKTGSPVQFLTLSYTIFDRKGTLFLYIYILLKNATSLCHVKCNKIIQTPFKSAQNTFTKSPFALNVRFPYPFINFKSEFPPYPQELGYALKYSSLKKMSHSGAWSGGSHFRPLYIGKPPPGISQK